jgi:2,3-dihydroxybiphenyl 1,2-dioxygenase
MSEIRGLGYIGVEVEDVAAWEGFATTLLGLQLSGRDNDGSIRLRMDEHAHRVAVHPGAANDLQYVGWEVADAGGLQALRRRMLAAGITVNEESPEHSRSRNAREVVSFVDPEGLRHEAFYGPLLLPEAPFNSPRPISGFVTGEQGCGHVVLQASNPAAYAQFFTDVLGFRISDYIDNQTPRGIVNLVFLHCSSRHHSLAIGTRMSPGRLNHIMFEVRDIDDVGIAYDLAQRNGYQITATLGRHTNDRMLSFYVATPAGFSIEYGWGGLAVNDADWHVRRYEKPSVWGHIRSAGAARALQLSPTASDTIAK